MRKSHVGIWICWVALASCAASEGPARIERTGAPATRPMLRPSDGIAVDPDAGRVEIDAWTCLDGGWLEQIACMQGTREHESLVVVRARPRDVHAALLLAGFQHGHPGSWSYENEQLAFEPPSGDVVAVRVRYERDGRTVETPISEWIEDANGVADFPSTPWVFAGSLWEPLPDSMGGGEHYVADMTGSIVGLVTFGDEVIAFSQVLADETEVQPPLWQVAQSGVVPPVGTKVTLVLAKP